MYESNGRNAVIINREHNVEYTKTKSRDNLQTIEKRLNLKS